MKDKEYQDIINKILEEEKLEEAEKACDEGSDILTYPELANKYMEQGEWDKADSTIKQYLVYLHEMCNGRNILDDQYCRKFELGYLFHTVERLSNYFQSIGETYQATTCLSSISRFMNFCDERTQFYYDASLARMFQTAFLESCNNAKENFDCLKGEGPGAITEDMEKIMSELQKLQ